MFVACLLLGLCFFQALLLLHTVDHHLTANKQIFLVHHYFFLNEREYSFFAVKKINIIAQAKIEKSLSNSLDVNVLIRICIICE